MKRTFTQSDFAKVDVAIQHRDLIKGLVLQQLASVIVLDHKGVRKLRKILKEYDLSLSRQTETTT